MFYDLEKSSGDSMVRLKVNLNRPTVEALLELAQDRELSLAETLRRAISLYGFLCREQQEGREIRITEADGKVLSALADFNR